MTASYLAFQVSFLKYEQLQFILFKFEKCELFMRNSTFTFTFTLIRTISGQDEEKQEEQSGAKSGSVSVWLCHVRSRLGFYEVTGNLDTYKRMWCYEKDLHSAHFLSNWLVIWFVFVYLITFV